MKKVSIFGTLLGSVLFTIILISCDKQANETMFDEPTNLKKEFVDGYLKYSINKQSLITNLQDKDDEMINSKLYDVAKDLQEVLKDKDTRNTVIDLVKNYSNDYIPLRSIIEEIPSIQTKLFNGSFNNEEHLMEYENVIYELVINIPNIEKANFNQFPIISSGIEVEDNKSLGINDYIFGWYLNDKSTESIAIGEEQALQMTNPLFIVSPHPIEGELGYSIPNPRFEYPILSNSFYRSSDFEIEKHQVNDPYHFENRGDIEYYPTLMTTFKNSNNPDPNNTFERKVKIDKDDVTDSILFEDDLPFGNYEIDFGIDYYLLTYERDWAKSRKTVTCSCSCSNSSSYSLFPRMGYSSNYYNRICGQTSNAWPNINDSKNNNVTRGRIQVTRVN